MNDTALLVKRSQLPNAGKGVFTKKEIKRSSLIIEYQGVITTWNAVQQSLRFNGYVYYINRNHVIDSKPCRHHIARYINDAKGLSRINGLKNNCCYKIINNRVFIKALRDIKAGEELFVGYGRGYWEVIAYNMNLSKK